MSHVIEIAGSYYIARWLVPAGLARKEQFLPRVKDWIKDATGNALIDLALDGWIDLETAKQNLLELNSNDKLTPDFKKGLASSIPEFQEKLTKSQSDT